MRPIVEGPFGPGGTGGRVGPLEPLAQAFLKHPVFRFADKPHYVKSTVTVFRCCPAAFDYPAWSAKVTGDARSSARIGAAMTDTPGPHAIVDTHVHLWDPARTDRYPRLSTDQAQLGMDDVSDR